MYDINDWDLQLLMDNFIYHHKSDNENTRKIQYSVIGPYLKPQDRHKNIDELFPLISDKVDINKFIEEDKTKISDDDIDRLGMIAGMVKDLEFKQVEFER